MNFPFFFFFCFWLVLNIFAQLRHLAIFLLATWRTWNSRSVVLLIPVLVLFVVPRWNATPQHAFTFPSFRSRLPFRLAAVEVSLVRFGTLGLICISFYLCLCLCLRLCLCSGLQHNLSLARGKRFIMFVRWFLLRFVCFSACCDSIRFDAMRFDCRLISCYQTSPVNHR